MHGVIMLRKWLGGLVNILGVSVCCKQIGGKVVHSISRTQKMLHILY